MQGIVQSVQSHPGGGYPLEIAPVGATSILFEDASDFDSKGGFISVEGSVLAYTSVDMDEDVLHLAEPLTVAIDTEDFVATEPATEVTYAEVAQGESFVTAEVPHGLKPFLEVGERGPEEGEAVIVEEVGVGRHRIVDIVGTIPAMDAEFVNGAERLVLESGKRLGEQLAENRAALDQAETNLAAARQLLDEAFDQIELKPDQAYVDAAKQQAIDAAAIDAQQKADAAEDAAVGAAASALQAAEQELADAIASGDQAAIAAAQTKADAARDAAIAAAAADATAKANAARDAAISAAASDATAKAAEAMTKATQALTAAQAAQASADGAVRTYYSASPPWANGASRPDADLGDMWFDTDDGQAHRWNGSTWQVIEDQSIGQALAAAQTAQTTADGKITAYYQDAAPLEADEGDLWFDTDDGNRVHRRVGSSWIDVADARIAVQATAITNLQNDLIGLDGKVDGQSVVWVQSTAPTQMTADDKGDIWINDGASPRVTKVWNGTAWVEADSRTTQAVADITKKTTTFYQATAPAATAIGDLWVDSDDKKLYRATALGTGSWVEVTYIDPRVAQQATAIATAQGQITGLRTDVDKKAVIWYQPSAPTGLGVDDSGDIWIDSDANPKTYKSWSGSAWVDVTDATTLSTLATVQTKTTTFYQATAPAATAVGDLWIDTDDNNKLYRASAVGSASWVSVADARIAAQATALNDVQSRLTSAEGLIDGKAVIHYQPSAPTGLTSADQGDIWIDSDANPKTFKSWSGTAWVDVTDATAIDALAKVQTKTTTYQTSGTTAPTAPAGGFTAGDLWVDGNGKIARWSGSAWVTSVDPKTLADNAQAAAITAARQAVLAAEASADNKVVNPGFELDLDGWTKGGNPSIASGSARSGEKCAAMGGTSDIASNPIAVQPGEVWRYGYWYRGMGTGPGGLRLQTSADGTTWTSVSSSASGSTETAVAPTMVWTEQYREFTVPTGVAYIRVRIAVAMTNALYVFDDVYARNFTEVKRLEQVAADVEQRALSRGTDLVTNGTGYLKSNYNFPGMDYVGSDSPVGAQGSFRPKTTSQTSTFTDELIPIDPSKAYRVSIQARQTVPGASGRIYLGLSPYDADGLVISPLHYMSVVNTQTTLAQALNPGDTKVYLTSAANWYGQAGKNAGASATYLRGIIFWDYTDGSGKLWEPGTYSRNVYYNLWDDGGITGNVITLKTPWTGPAKSAGTPVSNSTSGGNYMYLPSASYVTPPETWTQYSDILKAGTMTLEQQAVTSTGAATFSTGVPIPTASLKIVFLINYPSATSGAPTGLPGFAAISFSDAAAAQARAEEAEANAKAFATTQVNGVSKSFWSTALPGTTQAPKDSTWYRHDAAGKIIAVFNQTAAGTGATWTARPITSEAIDNLDVGKLSVSGSSTFNQAVISKMAVQLANIITARIENLTVTETSQLNTVVAQRIAANVGEFVSIVAQQITGGQITAAIGIGTNGKIIAGDPAGARVEIANDGVRVYVIGPNGAPYPAVSMVNGLISFGVVGQDGSLLGGIASDGSVTGSNGAFSKDVSIMGRPIVGRLREGGGAAAVPGWLDNLPRGIIRKTTLPESSQSATIATGTEGSSIGTTVRVYPDRQYRIVAGARFNMGTAGGVTLIRIRHAVSPDKATTSSPMVGLSGYSATSASTNHAPHVEGSALYTPPVEQVVNFRMTFQGFYGATPKRVGGYIYVEDVGPVTPDVGVDDNDNLVIYQSTWKATASREYSANGAMLPNNDNGNIDNWYWTTTRETAAWIYGGGAIESSHPTELGKTLPQALSGATLQKVEIYLHSKLWWGDVNAGAVVLNTLGAASLPTSKAIEGSIWTPEIPEGQGIWVEVPKTWFTNGANTGVTMGDKDGYFLNPTTSANEFLKSGVFYGVNDPNPPLFRATYVR